MSVASKDPPEMLNEYARTGAIMAAHMGADICDMGSHEFGIEEGEMTTTN